MGHGPVRDEQKTTDKKLPSIQDIRDQELGFRGFL
jgi:hypothetical protein